MLADTAAAVFFTPEELAGLDPSRIPKHIAIIPDGNRRWAKKLESEVQEGHREGSHTLISITKAAKQLGVKVMTFYLFSTENWTRPQWEVDALMWLLKEFLIDQRQTLLEDGIHLQAIGDLSRLPPDVLAVLRETDDITSCGTHMDLVLALNYGARDELRRAFQALLADCNNHKLQPQAITESTIAHYLDTARWPDPDLLIRTSGEMRVSNFLLWQLSYTEIYVTNALWPEFSPKHLLEALMNFQTRIRRHGGT